MGREGRTLLMCANALWQEGPWTGPLKAGRALPESVGESFNQQQRLAGKKSGNFTGRTSSQTLLLPERGDNLDRERPKASFDI